jgi:long-chain acyl-CoA synthetase
MRNLPEWSIAFWAITAAGGVAVPLNAWWTGGELEYGLADSGARLLFADAERIERLAPHLGALDLDAVVGTRTSAPQEGVVQLRELMGDAPGEAPLPNLELPEVELRPDSAATLFYTSGTTGRPKGVVGTHRNICTNLWTVAFARARSLLRSGASRAAIDQLEENPAFLLSVPLFHVTGCHSVLLSTTALGAKLVLMHKWDPEHALELIERERITTFGGVPAMAWQVLESPDFERRDTSSIRSIRYGGAPAPAELVRRIDQLLPGRTPSNGYGMTETSAIASSNAGDDYRARPDSVGVAVPVCDVRIVDDDGSERPRGEIGELWIRGPNVARGYWNQPEATAATFGDGWLRTGDIARIDDEGFITIVDRAKDVVIRAGENIYCAQLEQALFEHSAVSDAAVIGVPHRVLGEEVGAVVVRRPGVDVSEQELRDHVRSRLAAFNVPTHIWLRDEPLPRNPAGKVLKAELKRELIGEPAP